MSETTLHNCISCKDHIFECGQFSNTLGIIHCQLDGEHKTIVNKDFDVIVLDCNKEELNEI